VRARAIVKREAATAAAACSAKAVHAAVKSPYSCCSSIFSSCGHWFELCFSRGGRQLQPALFVVGPLAGCTLCALLQALWCLVSCYGSQRHAAASKHVSMHGVMLGALDNHCPKDVPLCQRCTSSPSESDVALCSFDSMAGPQPGVYHLGTCGARSILVIGGRA
jgi:hypothetical protein